MVFFDWNVFFKQFWLLLLFSTSLCYNIRYEPTSTQTWHTLSVYCVQQQTFKILWNKWQCFFHLKVHFWFHHIQANKQVISSFTDPTVHLHRRHKSASSTQYKCVCKLVATGSYEMEACTDRQTEMNSNKFQYCLSSMSICRKRRGDDYLTEWLVSWPGLQCRNGSFTSVIR